MSQLPLDAVLRETSTLVVGGLAQTGDFVVFRHSIPLSNMDINEFERPLRLVTKTADVFEAKFLGTDNL